MTIPSNVNVIENEVGKCWIEDDILVFVENATEHSLEDYRRNRNMLSELTGGRRLPVLLYLKDCPIPDQPARQFVSDSLRKNYTAIALVSSPELAEDSIRNFGLRNAPVPVMNFTDDWAAKKWLEQFAHCQVD
jgi:hypothetical protein